MLNFSRMARHCGSTIFAVAAVNFVEGGVVTRGRDMTGVTGALGSGRECAAGTGALRIPERLSLASLSVSRATFKLSDAGCGLAVSVGGRGVAARLVGGSLLAVFGGGGIAVVSVGSAAIFGSTAIPRWPLLARPASSAGGWFCVAARSSGGVEATAAGATGA